MGFLFIVGGYWRLWPCASMGGGPAVLFGRMIDTS